MRDDPEKWCQELLNGDQAFATYLLLTLMPRVLQLSIDVFRGRDQVGGGEESESQEQGAKDFMNAVTAIAHQGKVEGSSLSHLKYIEVKSGEQHANLPTFNFLGPLMALPQASALQFLLLIDAAF